MRQSPGALHSSRENKLNTDFTKQNQHFLPHFLSVTIKPQQSSVTDQNTYNRPKEGVTVDTGVLFTTSTRDHQFEMQNNEGEHCRKGTDTCWAVFLLSDVETGAHTSSLPQPRSHKHQECIRTWFKTRPSRTFL